MTALYIGLGFLFAILLLLIFMIVRTFWVKPAKISNNDYVNHALNKEELAKNLSGAIKIPTVSMANDKMPKQPFFDFRDYIEKTYPEFAKSAKRTIINEFSLIYYLEGQDKDLLPACFLSHIDVVPASKHGWDFDPFSGMIDGGYVYGRGAQDMKSQMISVLGAIEYTLKSKKPLKRSIYCCFGHDEELSGIDGAPKIAEYLESQNVKLEFVFDEGGAIIDGNLLGVDKRLALISTCEKGYMDVKLSIKEDGGHASTPKNPTILSKLSKAIVKLEKHRMRPVWTEPVKELFRDLSPYIRPLFRFFTINRDILSFVLKPAMATLHPVSQSLVRTTFAPTMIKGSDAANVLPGYAEAIINCRIIHGNTTEDVLKHIKKVVGKNITVSKVNRGDNPSKISPTNSLPYKTISNAIKAVYGDIVVAPLMFIAASDARFYARICKNIYGFTPFYFNLDDQKRVHGINERCDIDALNTATELFIKVLEDTCINI